MSRQPTATATATATATLKTGGGGFRDSFFFSSSSSSFSAWFIYPGQHLRYFGPLPVLDLFEHDEVILAVSETTHGNDDPYDVDSVQAMATHEGHGCHRDDESDRRRG